MSVSLTPKQRQIFGFISNFYDKKGYAPTLKEIAKNFKISTTTAHQYIESLIKKEYLHKTEGSVRNIIPVSQRPGANHIVQRRLRIGVIGYGIVGQAVEYGFSNSEIHIYDKYKESETLKETVENSDYIFICLPTPVKKDESGIDLSIINHNIKKIAKYTNGTDKIIIIKSTVIPGTTEGFIKKYPKTLFCFNPEFTTERSFLQDFVNADRVIIGADSSLVFRRVSSIYQSIIPNTPIFQTDPTSAEMVKYMANCFLATKVIFANEMYDICKALNIKYEEVKEMVVADKRIYDSHLDITTMRGFGGKCFPKDLLALKGLAKNLKVDTKILDSVWNKNLKIRKVKDWEDIPFAVGDSSFGNKS
ncbi:helix-turn-helix domain-containing protein [Candidatus Woesebacteria bacterium]|nr:helix-turn-helix domain-containing protein [Candidatus Woesebacteria bacterium]